MSDPNSIALVVCDDQSVRDSVADLLASAGFAVQTFGAAAEFI
jgi:FixJ family two-component response regulator